MNEQNLISSDAVALERLKPHLESVFRVEANKTSPNARVGITVRKSLKCNVFFVSEVREDSIFSGTGLRTGNILLSINGKVCPGNLKDVLSTIGSIGGLVQLTVARTKPSFEIEDADEEKGKHDDDEGQINSRRLRVFEATRRKKSEKLGFTIDVGRFKNPDGSNQLVVTRVHPNGTFPDLKRGSILRSINGEPCTEYKKAVKILRSSQTIRIDVEEPARPTLANGRGRQRSVMLGRREIKIETPPRAVVLIWSLIAAELLFDLITTGVAFAAFFSKPRVCCEEEIENSFSPLATSIPFAFLVIVELGFLLRAMRITLWPPNMTEEELDPNRSCCSKLFFGSNPGIVVAIINLLTIINPYFGFFIAWMLIYQSSEQEAYLVIGMECVSIVLHFISVHYEGQARTFLSKLMHSLVIVPFVASGVLLSWYLQVKGICYNSELNLFWFDGCEVCPNGLPPEDGFCTTTTLVNGVSETKSVQYFIWELEQNTTCDDEKGLKMCFFHAEE